MTKYTYVLKADQTTGGYNSSYRGMDVIVTVVAETWDLAREEAERILPPLKSPTSSWAFWSKSITPYEEPDTRLAEYAHIIAEATAKVFFKEANRTPIPEAKPLTMDPETIHRIHDAIRSVPPECPTPDYSTYDTQAFIDIYIPGPVWDPDHEEYWATCDACYTETGNAHENVTEDWMIDHANAHIGGTI